MVASLKSSYVVHQMIKVGDPEEGVGVHHRRDHHVLLSLQNLAHRPAVVFSPDGRKKRFGNVSWRGVVSTALRSRHLLLEWHDLLFKEMSQAARCPPPVVGVIARCDLNVRVAQCLASRINPGVFANL